MDAYFFTAIFDGKLEADELNNKYDELAAVLQAQPGRDPDSRPFAVLPQLKFVASSVLDTQSSAHAHLRKICVIGERAIAIRFKQNSYKHTVSPGNKWLVGGWCVVGERLLPLLHFTQPQESKTHARYSTLAKLDPTSRKKACRHSDGGNGP